MTIRVLHVPDAVGGNPQGLARAERELGLDSVSVVFAESPFGYPADEILRPTGTTAPRYAGRRARLLLRALVDFNVVHFNFGRTLAPAWLPYADLPLLKAAGKVVVVTFQGDDVRRGDVARARGGISLPTMVPQRYPRDGDQARRRRADAFARHADAIFYLNPDLAAVLPARARFLPYAHVDPRDTPVAPPRVEDGPIVVVHAPSDRAVKGTEHVVAAVKQLRRSGMDVVLDLVEGVPNVVARRRYASADLAVDQLFAGWYGGFAVEVMALGKPVVSFVRMDDLDVLDPAMRVSLPIANATSESVAEVLGDLLAGGRPALAAAGERSRAYVERWHDPRSIARVVVSAYEAALSRPRRFGGRRRARARGSAPPSDSH